MQAHWFNNSNFHYEFPITKGGNFFIKKGHVESQQISNHIYRFNPDKFVGERFITCQYKYDTQIDGNAISVFEIIAWSNQ